MNNAPRKKFTLKQRVVITIVATIVALPVLLIIYTLSGALPWWYYFTGRRLAQTWPDDEVAILVADAADANYIYWPRSGKSYTFHAALGTDSRQRTTIRAKKTIWVKIEHNNRKFIVTDQRLKTGIWKESESQSTCFAISDHQAYSLSPSTAELMPWPVDYQISGNWICIRSKDNDGKATTTVYRYDANNRRLYNEYRDAYGWIMGNSIILVAGNGSVTRTDLDTRKSHDIGTIGTTLNTRSFVASGRIFMNGNSVYRCDGNSVKMESAIRPRYGEIGAMFNGVSIVDGFIIHKYLYNLTYIAGFDVYRAGSSDLVAATVKGVDISYAISSDDAKLLIDIDRHGLKNARYIP